MIERTFEEWTAIGEDGMQVHLLVALTKDGQGPASGADIDHFGCWCGETGCEGPPLARRPRKYDPETTDTKENAVGRVGWYGPFPNVPCSCGCEWFTPMGDWNMGYRCWSCGARGRQVPWYEIENGEPDGQE